MLGGVIRASTAALRLTRAILQRIRRPSTDTIGLHPCRLRSLKPLPRPRSNRSQGMAPTSTQGKKGRTCSTTPPPQRGSTNQAYLLLRLARDAPELLERVKAGEINSARAAAIEAGIIKPVPTVRLTSPNENDSHGLG